LFRIDTTLGKFGRALMMCGGGLLGVDFGSLVGGALGIESVALETGTLMLLMGSGSVLALTGYVLCAVGGSAQDFQSTTPPIEPDEPHAPETGFSGPQTGPVPAPIFPSGPQPALDVRKSLQ
jgi:hypothetical protein